MKTTKRPMILSFKETSTNKKITFDCDYSYDKNLNLQKNSLKPLIKSNAKITNLETMTKTWNEPNDEDFLINLETCTETISDPHEDESFLFENIYEN